MNSTTIWYDTPAKKWLQCLPVGNGHIGCMVSADPYLNTLNLNDDTLWSGYQRNYLKPDFQKDLLRARELLLKNDRAAAEEIVETRLTNRFTQAYLPLGDLIIHMPKGEVREFYRALDMKTGIVSASYRKDGIFKSNETFASYPDDVLIHSVNSEEPEDFDIQLTCALQHEIRYDSEGLTLVGRAPSDLIIGDVGNFSSVANKLIYDYPERGMLFAARLQISTDGMITVNANSLKICGARHSNLFITTSTSFSKGKEYLSYCVSTVNNARNRTLSQLREAHIQDHAALFLRTQLDLGESDDSCEKRISRMRQGEINGSDISLLFHYGRYLLIASSRRGTQAANLQGIWNRDLIPPWWSGYTLNINLQMNYWLADRVNLQECFEPLSDFTQRLCEAGKRTAREDYGAEGSVAHHQSDLWAHSTPVGLDRVCIPKSARWMMWNMPLPWLCIQLYDHYQYIRDERFLVETLYPIMKNAADFMRSTFTRFNGFLCNVPSTSPENMYRDKEGRSLAICAMSAMDIGIAKEFALAYTQVCNALKKNDVAKEWENFSKEIQEYTISQSGMLQEWDDDYEQTELGHRHFSMLFGIYPGSSLLSERYSAAARLALEERLLNGSGQTGWSAVWAALLLARFGEGDAAYTVITKLMHENIHDNMFGAHPPELFQIDANFGFSAAICEMLIQEIEGVIKLLPALPNAIPSGTLTGIMIHGGHAISLKWNDLRLEWIELEATCDDELVFDGAYMRCESEIFRKQDGKLHLRVRTGERYHFVCDWTAVAS